MIIHIKDKTYNKELKKNENPFVLIFVSKFCPHCKTIEKLVKNIEKEYKDVTFYFVKSEESTKLLRKFNIRGFPTSLFIKEDKIIRTMIGFSSQEEFYIYLKKLNPKKKKLLQRIFK